MCSEWRCEECSLMLSIHVTAANCLQCDLGTAFPESALQQQKAEPLRSTFIYLFIYFFTFLQLKLFDNADSAGRRVSQLVREACVTYTSCLNPKLSISFQGFTHCHCSSTTGWECVSSCMFSVGSKKLLIAAHLV